MPVFENVDGHIEVHDVDGRFLFSADTEYEATKELMAHILAKGITNEIVMKQEFHKQIGGLGYG